MTFLVALKIAAMLCAIWVTFASLIGAIQLKYRPLIFEAILFAIAAIPFVLQGIGRPWQLWYSLLIIVPFLINRLSGLNTTVKAYLETRGLSWRELMLLRHRPKS
jgi:hypothetical protein